VIGKECQTLGTWIIYDDSTRKIVLITGMYFFSLYLFRIK
jgi:hypothetical protein